MNKMRILSIVIFLLCTQLCIAQNSGAIKSKSAAEYVCSPCGNDCDKIVLHASGKCEHCNMPLVKKSSVVFKEIKPSEICSYVAAHPGVVLLDVRTKDEFENKGFHKYGTLKNAINIPVDDLPSRLSELSAYKNKEIIVYCSHSQRSPRASHLLTENGFTKVFNMSGGMSVMNDDTCKK
jgi:rhodanese-related sulfurtransferase/DNA-directed RNA polymerase subunit RPC12/RpoP